SILSARLLHVSQVGITGRKCWYVIVQSWCSGGRFGALVSCQHFRCCAVAGADCPIDIPHPSRRCFCACPMNATMRLANYFSHGCHDSRPHGSSIAAPAPDFGRPILVLVIDGVSTLWSEKLDNSLYDYLLTFLHGSPRPLERVVSLEKSNQESLSAVRRGSVADSG